MKIFVISGKAETGKNKVATLLKEIYEQKNKKTVNVAYASYLKEYAKNILNWDGNEASKPRDFLQYLGIDIIKNQIDNKMLIRRIIEDIKVYSNYFDVVTISDARFKEEIEDIKNIFHDVITIHILEKENSLTEVQKNHITEIALDGYQNYDYEISNKGTVEELKKLLQQIINEVDNNE